MRGSYIRGVTTHRGPSIGGPLRPIGGQYIGLDGSGGVTFSVSRVRGGFGVFSPPPSCFGVSEVNWRQSPSCHLLTQSATRCYRRSQSEAELPAGLYSAANRDPRSPLCYQESPEPRPLPGLRREAEREDPAHLPGRPPHTSRGEKRLRSPHTSREGETPVPIDLLLGLGGERHGFLSHGESLCGDRRAR